MEQEGGSGVLAKRQSEVAPLRNVLMKHPRDAFFNDLAIAEQFGARIVLPKPVERQVLLQAVQDVLQA